MLKRTKLIQCKVSDPRIQRVIDITPKSFSALNESFINISGVLETLKLYFQSAFIQC